MGYRFNFFLVAVLLQVCATASAKEKTTIGVLDYVATSGTDPEIAEALTIMQIEKIGSLGDVRVVGEVELRAMLTMETKECLLELEWQCPAEGFRQLMDSRETVVRWVVSGRVTMFDNIYVLTLKLFDLRYRAVAGRVVHRVLGGPEELQEGLSDATDKLFEEAADSLQLVPTVTVASRRIQLLEESPSAVTVFTKEDIASSGAYHLSDILRRVPGFDVYETNPSYPLVGARSLTEESNNLVLALIDGREALLEFAGVTLWSGLAITLEEIERIEVIRGPGSALYGANAFSAVVSIKTVAEQSRKGASVFLSTGEEGRYRISGMASDYMSLGEGTVDYGLTLGTQEARSTSDIRDYYASFLRTHGYLRYRQGDSLDLSLHGGVFLGRAKYIQSLGDFRTEPFNRYWEMAKARFSLGETSRFMAQLYHTAYIIDFTPRARYRAYDMWIFDIPLMSFRTDSFDGQVQFDWEAASNFLLIAGGNLRYTTTSCVNALISDDDDLRAAGFLHIQWSPWEKIQFTGGIRADLSPEAEEKVALSPRLAAVVSPWEHQFFRLGYGMAFRKPSVYESRFHGDIQDFNPATPEIVEKLRDQFGNEKLKNEKVHSFEVGWRGRFLEERLNISVELFYNLYQDTISFVIDIPFRLGLPDMTGSTLQFRNEQADIAAFGGEAELSWRLSNELSFWCNLGLRKARNLETDQDRYQEPLVRANLGGRYLSSGGLLVDVALHYVSEYKMPLMNPANILDEPDLVALGNSLLLVSRMGYRLGMDEDLNIEGGITVRTPLQTEFREYPGIPLEPAQQIESAADFGGEMIMRLVSFYLRGSF